MEPVRRQWWLSPFVPGYAFMWLVRNLVLGVIFVSWLAAVSAARAEEAAFPVAIVRSIPHAEKDLATAFNASAAYTCQQIPAGQPLIVPDFRESLVYRWPAPVTGNTPSAEMRRLTSRLGILSFGLDMTPEDQRNLPFFSGGRIIERVTGDYIGIQRG